MTGSELFAAPGGKDVLEQGSRLTPRFGADGLIVCVTQDAASGEVVMVAHMNQEALARTIETGVAHYWSRTRGELWRKGDTSGAVQQVREMRIDCDQDAVLLRVTSENPQKTCHTGQRRCFYRSIAPGTPAGDARLVSDSDG